MEVTERYVFALDDTSRAGEARRTATTLATRLGAGKEDVGRIALVVTEAATNVAKHAQAGQLLLYGRRESGAWSVGMMAIDRGPGMRDLAACLEDGMSTAGTPGNGLGAIRRLATTFDAYTSPAGTVVFAEIDGSTSPRPAAGGSFIVGAVRVPYPGEEVCGDDLAVMPTGEDRCMILVVDGLGHGIGAAEAAQEATRLFRANPAADPEAVMSLLHDGLRGTRGAAAAVADVDLRTRTVRFAGVGNIAACVRGDRSQGMISQHGTLGHQTHRIQEFRYQLPQRALIVLHSDGLSARWDLASYPGLAARHPMVIAAVLYRDHGRRTDDASIVVLREAA